MSVKNNVINKTKKKVPINFTEKISELFFHYLFKLGDISGISSFIISIVFIEEKEIRLYNRKYRNKNISTDVLSFCTYEWKDPLFFKFYSVQKTCDLGDILISSSNVERNSIRLGIDQEEEFARVIVHGILHLLKFVHKKEINTNEKMYKIQESFLDVVKKKNFFK